MTSNDEFRAWMAATPEERRQWVFDDDDGYEDKPAWPIIRLILVATAFWAIVYGALIWIL